MGEKSHHNSLERHSVSTQKPSTVLSQGLELTHYVLSHDGKVQTLGGSRVFTYTLWSPVAILEVNGIPII